MPTDVKEVVAEPSAAQPELENSTATLTSAMKEAWNKGERPQPKVQESAPADTPEKTDEPAGDEPESAAAPGTAKDKQESHRKPKAEERIAQLIAENKRLKEDAAKEKTPKAESSPVPQQQAKPLEAPKKPSIEDFKTADGNYDFAKYDEAKDKYFEDVSEFKAQKAVQDYQLDQQRQAQAKEVQSSFDEAKKRYTDFETIVATALTAIKDDPAIANEVKAVIGASPVMADLLYAIGSDQDALADFIQTARANPVMAMRKALITEGLVLEELQKQNTKAAEKVETKEEKKTPVQTITRVTPKPVSEVGGRATSTEDSAMAATRSAGDRLTPDLKAEWTRRALGR